MPEAKLLICHMLRGATEGEEFSTWPLHLTILPWFKVYTNEIERTLATVEETARKVGGFTITATNRNWYGPKHNVPVIEVQDTSGRLQELHNNLLATLSQNSVQLDDLRFVGDSFSPHITIKREKQAVQPGQTLECASLTIVEKGPQPHNNHVLKTFKLNA